VIGKGQTSVKAGHGYPSANVESTICRLSESSAFGGTASLSQLVA
jgi:hypothetical protein